MSWFWMNMPAAAVCFAAWCGIPLYMVIKHPSWGPKPADTNECATKPERTAQAHGAALPSAAGL
jgi:hypothetical protein